MSGLPAVIPGGVPCKGKPKAFSKLGFFVFGRL